jgi:hypothetical protein
MKYVVHCDKIMVVDGGKVCIREFHNLSWHLLFWYVMALFCFLDEHAASIHRADK